MPFAVQELAEGGMVIGGGEANSEKGFDRK